VTDVKALWQALAQFSSEAPPALLEVLVGIAELASWETADALLSRVPENTWRDDALTPADIVAEVWLRQPKLVERERARWRTQRVRKFEYFQAIDTEQKHRPCGEPELLQLKADLAEHFVARKRGEGVGIWEFEQDGALWFVLGHGDTVKRDRSWNNGELVSVAYRPAKYDVVVYEPVLHELRISACAQWQKQLYRSKFSSLLFDDPNHFPGTNKYTLAPLEQDPRAAVACADVAGIEKVMLHQLRFLRAGVWNRESSDKGPDLLEDPNFRLPPGCRPLSATFWLKIQGRYLPRSLVISPSNVAKYTPDEDGGRIEEWMRLRGYMRDGSCDVDDETAEILDVA